MADEYDEVRLVFDRYQLLSQRTNEKKTDKGEINILPCQGHYLNPESLSEELPLAYLDKGRTNSISSCIDDRS